MLKIRPFVEGDEGTYVRVHNEGYSTEEWWGIAQKPVTIEDVPNPNYDVTFLAEVDGQVVGLVDIKSYGDEAHIESLVVLQEFRRKGIGTRLLNKAVDFSKSRGIKRIRAETPVQNASGFFEENGLRLVDHAFLVEIEDERKVEQYLNKKLYFEGKNQYWVPGEKEMQFVRKLKVDFKTIVQFKIMTKNV